MDSKKLLIIIFIGGYFSLKNFYKNQDLFFKKLYYAKEKLPYSHFVERLQNDYIFNGYRETEEKYKLIPAIQDKPDFFSIIEDKETTGLNGRIVSAYRYFQEYINKRNQAIGRP
ncbi:hypothetical protein [Picrophilus oshimae]|uniref:Uncharacterized protein n=1 Tax=Picrophilus torridus (strain ATCC 700027 / DSM 9790 / JCM 10055 / NBRC 100828 / KAW 2/3) TaxID=1122961 RepID=Q6L2Z2_PICTO|nr:hypothetical protein [Picrophilus oshimae]AAT42659.1 hypothetical protein PTO0074 [Picrophilus oshimae DSM 9789]